jgi:hypothetical protein
VSLRFNIVCGFHEGVDLSELTLINPLEAMMLSFDSLNLPNEINIPLKHHSKFKIRLHLKHCLTFRIFNSLTDQFKRIPRHVRRFKYFVLVLSLSADNITQCTALKTFGFEIPSAFAPSDVFERVVPNGGFRISLLFSDHVQK